MAPETNSFENIVSVVKQYGRSQLCNVGALVYWVLCRMNETQKSYRTTIEPQLSRHHN